MSNDTDPYQFGILMLTSTSDGLLNLVSMPISALNFVLIFRASVIHPNLKLILLFQSFFILLRAVSRFALCLSKYILLDPISPDRPGFNPVVDFFYQLGIYTRNFVVHVLIIERIMATVMVGTYETKRSRLFSMIWCPIVLVLGLYNVVMPMVNSAPETNLITTSALFLLGIVELAIFQWLWRYNAIAYRTKLARLNRHSLTERYQLSENIRIGKQLTPALVLHIFNIFTGGSLLYWSYFAMPGILYFYAFVANSNSLCGLLIEYSMITCHPFLKRNFDQLRQRIFRPFLCQRRAQVGASTDQQNNDQNGQNDLNATSGQIALRDLLNGNRLIMAESPREHFARLRNIWGTIPPASQ